MEKTSQNGRRGNHGGRAGEPRTLVQPRGDVRKNRALARRRPQRGKVEGAAAVAAARQGGKQAISGGAVLRMGSVLGQGVGGDVRKSTG